MAAQHRAARYPEFNHVSSGLTQQAELAGFSVSEGSSGVFGPSLCIDAETSSPKFLITKSRYITQHRRKNSTIYAVFAIRRIERSIHSLISNDS